ncbi:MAG: DUF6090 family protein [Bacteroidota bacterium]
MKQIKWQYTIGEIIIVMIGITLAFGLNNLKDNLQEDQNKRQYLEHLLIDLKEERQQLESLNQAFEQKIQAVRDIRPHLGNPMPGRDTVIRKFFFLAEALHFTPEQTAYQTMINSGDLKLIDDFELRRHIEAHYNGHTEVQNNYRRLENIYTKYLADFFIFNLDYGALLEGDARFLDHPTVKGITASLEGSFNFAVQANTNCLESNQALTELVQVALRH